MSPDQRDTQRHRTLKGGHIVVNDGFSTFDCMVRNLSDSGAKLIVASSIGIPQRFDLKLDDGRQFACEMAWHTATEIGIHFIDRP